MGREGARNLTGGYLLLALALLTALSLVALHPEADEALVVGVVMLTVGLAIWLPLPLLIPAIVAVWLIPPFVRDAVTGGEGSMGRQGVILAGQLILGIATYTAYRLLRRQPEPEPQLQPVAATTTAPRVIHRPLPLTGTRRAKPDVKPTGTKPALPCGRVLRWSDATAFVERLTTLSRELDQIGETVRASYRNLPGPGARVS